MNIGNLGPSVLGILVERKFINTFCDFLELEKKQSSSELQDILKKSLLNKIIVRTIRFEGVPLENFIYAVGLPCIDNAMSKQLSDLFRTRNRFMFFLECLNTRAKQPVEYHIERIHNDVYLDKQYFLRARLLLGVKKLEKITKYLLVPKILKVSKS